MKRRGSGAQLAEAHKYRRQGDEHGAKEALRETSEAITKRSDNKAKAETKS